MRSLKAQLLAIRKLLVEDPETAGVVEEYLARVSSY
jgi:hypothetical protein